MQVIEGAVIACAGLGSRLGMGMPKCMIEVGGKTLLSRLIETLQPLVPRIHVVVGYREELIIEHCARHHREVIIARNPEFRTTNTAHSIRLGSTGMCSKVLYLDGDLIIEPSSLQSFVELAAKVPLLVGVTQAKSSQAVFVATHDEGGAPSKFVDNFQRTPATPWEWANVFAGSPNLLAEGMHYVYECIEPHLPVAAHVLNLHEIDTQEDLVQAKAWIFSSQCSTVS
ncbi:NTP transferase domain-containing protein [Ottowia sp. VDI28]|uniref:NTP transferase domain-containing protein n=1 Tax=Ottowia sp. VDI28 TaxID=3133968 RepID=UPI003C2D7DE9